MTKSEKKSRERGTGKGKKGVEESKNYQQHMT